MRRRTFLSAGLSAAAAGSAVSCAGGNAGTPWRFFTAAEGRAAEAVCSQLIPLDRDPGAREAGVVNYIDTQLATRFKKHRAAYRRELAALDSGARAKYGQPFAALSSGQQVEMLKAFEKNSRAFFDLILAHARQGFYGDPRHGGNRNMASWKMLGLPFPPVRGRQHDDRAEVL